MLGNILASVETKVLNNHRRYFSQEEIPKLYYYQEKAIQSLVKKINTAVIVPTGGGKSLVYYLAGLELGGTTLVISPLKALMQEQVNDLISRGISAISFTSDIGFQDQRKILRNLNNANYQFVYVSPERLQDFYFRASLVHSTKVINLIVVDEAHCISQWGHDFRPEYGEILQFIKFMRDNGQNPVILALTATLSNKALRDINSEFGIMDNTIFSEEDLIRQELKLFFKKVSDKTAEVEKWNGLLDFLRQKKSKKALIYFYSKIKCEQLAGRFAEEKPFDELTADYFHADLDVKSKKIKYDLFRSGKINILFTTTAFGMGMNIPDIDTIIQYHLPKSIEEYYQQVGRGARVKDLCAECNCLLFWSEENIIKNRQEYIRERFDSKKIAEGIEHLVSSRGIGKVSSVTYSALKNVRINISVLRYYLEKLELIQMVGEINGGPESIRFKNDTEEWRKIKNASVGNSFIIASKKLNQEVQELINYVYSQDLIGNVEYLPAMKKMLFIKTLFDNIPEKIVTEIIDDNNKRIDYQIERFNELVNLINSPDPYFYLRTVFKGDK